MDTNARLRTKKLVKRSVLLYHFGIHSVAVDTVSSFAGRGKLTCWNIWNIFPEVTNAFILFSWKVENFLESQLNDLLNNMSVYYTVKPQLLIMLMNCVETCLLAEDQLKTYHLHGLRFSNILNELFIRLGKIKVVNCMLDL